MENTNQFLGTERVGKLMRRYAVPCIISLLVGALYNIVDQIFIANASYLGSYGNAANTIAVMIGDGCCAFVSISLGKGEVGEARKSVGSAVVLSIASSLVLTALYLGFADPIISMFGGTVNEETFHYAREYFFYISLGIPFYMFGQAMNPVIRADGNPRFAMISTLAGAVLNIILDPIFIFECKWGMMGAAVAPVLGQIVTAALAVWYLCRMKTVKPEKEDFRLRASLCTRMLTLGITSFLSQISLVAAMAAINNMLRKYGALDEIFSQEQYAQIPMAVVGIVMKFFQIVISIVVGMAAGCIPVVGYNMGAGKKTRVRELFTKLLLCEAIVGAVALVLAEGFPRQLIAVFGAANESSYYTDFAIKAFRHCRAKVKPETQIHTHMCYSELTDIIRAIDDMDADVITFEASRSDLLILDSLKENHFKTEVGPGVYDIHSPRVPSVEEIKAALEKMLTRIAPEKLWVNPDCGLKTRGEQETVASLKHHVEAAKELRKEA